MRRRVTIGILALMALSAILIEACRKSDVTAAPSNTATPMALEIPQGFPAPQPLFADNPLTREGFALGRKLFYDGRLSKDSNFPCASCHQQFAGFATLDHPLSHGYNNQFTTRNAPGLFNLAWRTLYHWDGGINHLEVQPLAPITAPNEMAESVQEVINRLKADTAYLRMFKAAFGSEDINSQRMLKAIAQFTGAMVSGNAKFDKVKRGEASFSIGEQSGYNIFKAKCASCHPEPLFTDMSFRNTGLSVDPVLNDSGRMRITHDPNDYLKFMVPSLRNVYKTEPYGHDGRFYSIGAVIDHYRSGVIVTATTDSLVRKGIPVSDEEKLDLLSFLRTLTDTTFLNNPAYGPPGR
jgi:cytochrome c peroxidase